ncbi:MAG: hypothetical protein EOM91_12220, partial [Sphingobacteriia bacterium]|nr:hypothetical protein [Sphingobacteriia bacterium]
MSTPFNLVVFPEPVKPKQINRFERLKPSDLSTEEADAVVALALAVMKKRHRRGGLITSPQSAVEHLRLRLGELDHERFEVIYLDTRNRIIAIESLFRGTIDGANV